MKRESIHISSTSDTSVTHYQAEDFEVKSCRKRNPDDTKDHDNMEFFGDTYEMRQLKRRRAASKGVHHLDAFSMCRLLLQEANEGLFGSVARDIERVCAKSLHLLNADFGMSPEIPVAETSTLAQQKNYPTTFEDVHDDQLPFPNVIDLEEDHSLDDAKTAEKSIVILISDDEGSEDRNHCLIRYNVEEGSVESPENNATVEDCTDSNGELERQEQDQDNIKGMGTHSTPTNDIIIVRSNSQTFSEKLGKNQSEEAEDCAESKGQLEKSVLLKMDQGSVRKDKSAYFTSDNDIIVKNKRGKGKGDEAEGCAESNGQLEKRLELELDQDIVEKDKDEHLSPENGIIIEQSNSHRFSEKLETNQSDEAEGSEESNGQFEKRLELELELDQDSVEKDKGVHLTPDSDIIIVESKCQTFSEKLGKDQSDKAEVGAETNGLLEKRLELELDQDSIENVKGAQLTPEIDILIMKNNSQSFSEKLESCQSDKFAGCSKSNGQRGRRLELDLEQDGVKKDKGAHITKELNLITVHDNFKTSSEDLGTNQSDTKASNRTYQENENQSGDNGFLAANVDKNTCMYDYVAAKNDEVEDELAGIWKEMAFAMEYSKDVVEDPLHSEQKEQNEEDCDHSFLLKDDIGYVCRICGIIQKTIEEIFEFSFTKVKRSIRTYPSESRLMGNLASDRSFTGEIKYSKEDVGESEVFAHPRHGKLMKPHQVEGFKFLCSNLMTDKPGGCILAHAPGSGKTFMIISFLQSFLGRYPEARPLVVLPKGILGTWRKEFQTWQVEDFPLYDFYTSKADNRTQQLHVLEKWVNQKSVLFLGYQQFSTIIYDHSGDNVATQCQKILLAVPNILILDEGHTPRNEDSNVLQSLARVQTPLKVVLSGTLYQNHVKEVFNVLNLVRPKFLKLQTSRDVVRRIMSRVEISGKKHVRFGRDSAFYDLVEQTLQLKDEHCLRKAAIIKDLREMTSKVLHYYKGDFLDELPRLTDFTIVLNLSAKQKCEVENLWKLDKFKRNSVGSLLYVHPKLKSFSEKCQHNGDRGFLIDERLDDLSSKLRLADGVKANFFLNLLSLCESSGEKLLVFSQYIIPLKLFERLAVKVKGWSRDKEMFVITGDTNTEQREWSMEQFNRSVDAKVFFGSIKACGEGISLVGASRILILDVHLNPSVTRQAVGRAFRPGQKRKVYVYRLVAAESPEEEDHNTCFRKELISKMWFEWNEHCWHQEFEMQAVDIEDCGDPFLESKSLRQDIKVIYKR